MATQNSWKNISVVVLGRTIDGITAIKYKRTVKKEHVYGRGNKSQGIVSGNEEITGSITLLQSELEAMVAAAAAGGRNLSELALDIVHSYENDAGTITTDIVVGAQFTEYEKAMSQGDTHMKVELPYMALSLRENVQ